MIELNHILLFLALAGPVAVLVRSWQQEMGRSWRIAAALVLAVTGVAWIFFRPVAGYVGAGAWLAFLFLPAMGLKRVAELSVWHRYADARQIMSVLVVLHPGREMRQQIALFRDLEARQASGHLPPPAAGRAMRSSNRLAGCWAVTSLIVVNVICFAIEGRSSTDPAALSRLGALDTNLVIFWHQYWRMGTALFLHYGPLHLLFNLFALYVIGPSLERAIGGVRFLVCYLISGLGSSAGVVLLTLLRHPAHPSQLVGASGCVMGVLGVLAGSLLRDRHRPESRARLQTFLMIVAIQVLFDSFTPQVSMSAHMFGLITGFALGLVI